MSSKKVKLFSQDPKTKGRTVTLPLIGDTKFDDKDNSIEVDPAKVDELLTLDFGVPLIKSSEVNNDSKSKLKELSGPELQGLLKDFPKNETDKLKNNEDIIEYLSKKMDE